MGSQSIHVLSRIHRTVRGRSRPSARGSVTEYDSGIIGSVALRMSSFNTFLLRLEKSSSDNDIVHLIEHASRNALQLEEVAALAQRLAGTGHSLPTIQGPSADLASTGGPSSLSTLLCPLFFRLKGFTIPKLAVPGRPAGGIDVLATIPGYKTTLRPEEVVRCLEECGYCHFLASDDFVPLDARMFRLRQQIGAQDNPFLAIASLISKKLAAQVENVRLDVRDRKSVV